MDIIRIIQEAATWIEKVNPDYEINLYRSEELKPDRHFYDTDESLLPNLVKGILQTRSSVLQKSGEELIPVNQLHYYGRVVFFDIWNTIPDGVAEVESEYYVDCNKTPPHDTWIGLNNQTCDLFSTSIEAIASRQHRINKYVEELNLVTAPVTVNKRKTIWSRLLGR